MVVDDRIAALVADLEYLVGRKCFNPRSYDGYTGVTGRSFRYPVSYRIDGVLDSEKWKVYNPTPDKIDTMKYIFGSNHLFIGTALIDVLNALENRYGLDFNQLEANRAQTDSD